MQILPGEAATYPLAVADRLGRILAGEPVPDGATVSVSDGSIITASIEPDGLRIVGLAVGSAQAVYTGPLGAIEIGVEVVAPSPFKVVLGEPTFGPA